MLFRSNPLMIVIAPAERRILHARISTRFDAMLSNGLVDEVRQLMSEPGVHRQLPSMRSVGYRQTIDYLAGDIARVELPDRAKAATRQLARRQLTWLRAENGAVWLDACDAGLASRASGLAERHRETWSGGSVAE